jgi:hypothetical protein
MIQGPCAQSLLSLICGQATWIRSAQDRTAAHRAVCEVECGSCDHGGLFYGWVLKIGFRLNACTFACDGMKCKCFLLFGASEK